MANAPSVDSLSAAQSAPSRIVSQRPDLPTGSCQRHPPIDQREGCFRRNGMRSSANHSGSHANVKQYHMINEQNQNVEFNGGRFRVEGRDEWNLSNGSSRRRNASVLCCAGDIRFNRRLIPHDSQPRPDISHISFSSK